MIRLENLEALQRKIRQDEIRDLSTPTWDLVKRAIREGNTDQAIQFLDYACSESKAMHDSLVSFADGALSVVSEFNEEAIFDFLKARYQARIESWLSANLSVEEDMYRFSEQQRAHFGQFEVTEEDDRYIMSGPCGSGGRLRRSKEVAKTKKAYPWSWSKKNFPYYCVHCCIAWEIIPTELRGYPLRIHLVPDDPVDPCVHLFYKTPESIPEEYFRRIGTSKTIG